MKQQSMYQIMCYQVVRKMRKKEIKDVFLNHLYKPSEEFIRAYFSKRDVFEKDSEQLSDGDKQELLNMIDVENENIGVIDEDTIEEMAIENINFSTQLLYKAMKYNGLNKVGDLLEKARKVLCVELDSKMIRILQDRFSQYENFELINADILKVDLNEIICENKRTGKIKDVKVVANLPYYITTPIIMKLLEEKLDIESITVMIQKEVADMAKRSSKLNNLEDKFEILNDNIILANYELKVNLYVSYIFCNM